jgi:hypothetical protein
VLTIFGAVSAAVMVAAYALEARGSVWIAVFAGACVTTAVYGVLSGAWIFAALETVWAAIALRRFNSARSSN